MPERTTSTAPGGRLPRLTLPELWACLAVLLPVLGSLLATLSTVDLAYHVRAGEIALDRGALPSPDTFTFTAAGLPWLDQQWAAQVAFAAIFRLGGWALLASPGRSSSGSSRRSCSSAAAGRGRGSGWRPGSRSVGSRVGLVALGLRPQLLGMVLFAATAGDPRRPRASTTARLGDPAARPRLGERPRLVLPGAGGRRRRLARGSRRRPAGRAPAARRRARQPSRHARQPVRRRGLDVRRRRRREPDDPAADQRVADDVPAVVRRPDALRLDRGRRRRPGGRRPSRRGTPGGRTRPAVVRFLRRTWPTLAWLAGLAAIGAFAERGVAWWSIGFPVALAGLLRVAAETDP